MVAVPILDQISKPIWLSSVLAAVIAIGGLHGFAAIERARVAHVATPLFAPELPRPDIPATRHENKPGGQNPTDEVAPSQIDFIAEREKSNNSMDQQPVTVAAVPSIDHSHRQIAADSTSSAKPATVESSSDQKTPAVPAAAPDQRPQTGTVVSALPRHSRVGADDAPLLRWPIQGEIVSRFGERTGSDRNNGIDIAAPAGTPIRSAEDGRVIYAGDGLHELGNTVLIRHANGVVTVYGHAASLSVEKGMEVRRGQIIGTTGSSGETRLPKLHFEVRLNSEPVDPMEYLE